MDNQHVDNDPLETNENEEFGQFGPEGGDSRVDELDYYDQQDADDAAERALGVVPAFDPTHDSDDPHAIDPADRALASQAGDWTRRGSLFSLEQARGEPDTRAIYDPEDAHTAVDEVMEIIATRLAPDGSPLAADRNQLLYGFVHVLNAQSERLQKRVDNMARELRELIHAQDGSEVRDNDLSQKTDEARNLYDRALAFDRLTNTAALAYERFTDLVWSARESHKSTYSLTEPARAPKVSLADHLRARTWLERVQGTRIAVASGQRPGHELVWATLSRLRNEHPDLVVVTGGNKEGADRYAAEWAKQYDVPLDIVKPDFDAPDFNAELKARNTRIVHHIGEKGRKEEGAAIDGLVVFPGARTGVPGDLVAKARQARVPIAEIENAAQILNTRGPLMPGYKLDHNEFRPERDPGDTDPARGERRIINAAIAAQTHGSETPRQTISFAIHMLAERVTPDGVQLADEREKLLWGIGNVFNRQIERLNGEAKRAASDIDLTPETREAISRDYDTRRNSFIELFREARKIYAREARQPWNADGYARLDNTHTLATLEAESFLKQVEQHRHEAIYRNGQYVVAAGGKLAPEHVEAHRPIVDRYLDKLLDRYPDLVLAGAKGYAASTTKKKTSPTTTTGTTSSSTTPPAHSKSTSTSVSVSPSSFSPMTRLSPSAPGPTAPGRWMTNPHRPHRTGTTTPAARRNPEARHVISARRDDGKLFTFEPDHSRDWSPERGLHGLPRLDYGYALTFSSAQGATVDHAFVLADDRPALETVYPSLTRHRDRMGKRSVTQ